MSTTELKKKIIDEIVSLPDSSLEQLDGFVAKLKKEMNPQSDAILAMGGIWADIDVETLEQLTTGLPERRANNTRQGYE